MRLFILETTRNVYMKSKTFLWIEDRKGKAGYIFWESLLKQLYPNIQVESKKNSSELVKSVKNIDDIVKERQPYLPEKN